MRAGLPPVQLSTATVTRAFKSGGLATGTIINTGAEGGPDSDNSYTGQKVQGTAESTTINKNGRQIILFSGLAVTLSFTQVVTSRYTEGP